MNKYYTGCGSRDTPCEILSIFSDLACILAQRGYTLRSGGADGADSAFEYGCDLARGKKEIYLPWKNFNKHRSNYYDIEESAIKLASEIHLAWDKCKTGAKKLHARNCYQVLGLNLDTPSDFLICWTKNGGKVGGTRTAIVLAEKFDVTVYNFGFCNTKQQLKDLYERIFSERT